MLSLFEGHRTWKSCRSRLPAGLLAAIGILSQLTAVNVVRANSANRILFVNSQTSAPYLKFIDTAKLELQANNSSRITTVTLPAGQLANNDRGGEERSYDLVVALGGRAALAIQQWHPKAPVLYTLIPKATYDGLRKSGRLTCPDNSCTAIYIDQPLQRVFHILAAAFGEHRDVGVLLGPVSERQRVELSALAGETGISLHTAEIHEQDELLPTLNNLLNHSTLLLSIADPVVYNRRTAKSILLTTYHRRVPVMAYSKAYADAGATLSVFSTPEQIARQAAVMIRTYLDTGKHTLPQPRYPEHYKIRINHHVADSLGLDLERNTDLQSIIKGAEHEEH